MPVGFPVIAEPGTRVLRPAGLSSAERISDSLRVWGLRGLDATTPVATRTSHSWEQIIGSVTQRVGVASSALCLSFMRPNSVRNGSGWLPLGPTPNDSGDPESPADQRRGVLGRSGQDGTDARPCRPGPHGLWSQVAATRIRTLNCVGWSSLGPGHRLQLPG